VCGTGFTTYPLANATYDFTGEYSSGEPVYHFDPDGNTSYRVFWNGAMWVISIFTQVPYSETLIYYSSTGSLGAVYNLIADDTPEGSIALGKCSSSSSSSSSSSQTNSTSSPGP
jgi:hypothetical protein